MTFRKVPETTQHDREERCRHPEHEPPTMIVLEPGTYEWSCPACGAIRTVRVAPRGDCQGERAIYAGPHAAGKG